MDNPSGLKVYLRIFPLQVLQFSQFPMLLKYTEKESKIKEKECIRKLSKAALPRQK
jgi:hypothetical protein